MPVVADDSAGRRKAVQLRFAIELLPQHAALRPDGALCRVDVDSLHRREVDHQAVVDRGTSTDIVSATADGNLQIQRARELDGVRDVGGAMTSRDRGRPLVDEAVVHAARFVIPASAGCRS